MPLFISVRLKPMRGHSLVRRHPTEASLQRRDVQPQAFAPFRQRQTDPVSPYPSIVTGVEVLLLSCRPSAVARLVMAVVVDAVKAVRTAWTRPHVGKELREVVQPLVAHRNAASAVSVKGFVAGTRAPVLRSKPTDILAGRSDAPRHSVSRCFRPPAPATGGLTGTQRSYLSRSLRPAFALDQPLRGRRGGVAADRCPSAEPLSRQIDEIAFLWHGSIISRGYDK